MKRLSLSAALALLPFMPGSSSAQTLEYDFSNPAEVYRLTLGESMTRSGVSASSLYSLLRAGQLVLVNDHPAAKGIPWLTTAGILINAPPDAVFGVVADFAKYPEFMPQMGATQVKNVQPGIDLISYELAIKVLFVDIKVPYAVYHYHQPPKRTDWVMASGDFDANLGAYEVLPVPGAPNRSLLFYTSYSLPRSKMITSLFAKVPMLDLMVNLSTGTLVTKAMKKRCEAVYSKSGHPIEPASPLSYQTVIRSEGQNLAKLSSRGKVVLLEDTKPMFYTGAVVIRKPLSDVSYALTHLDEVSEIAKNYTHTYLERSPSGARVKVHTILPLVVDFTSDYTVKYSYESATKITFVGESGGDIEGVAGSYELLALSATETLLLYRNTSDLASQGYTMKKTLEVEPTLEQAIQASQTQLVIYDLKRFCEASPEGRAKMRVQK